MDHQSMTSNKVKVVLRLVAAMATFCAATLTYFTHQTDNFGDFSISVEFSDLTPYRCFLVTNFVAGAYSVVVFIILNYSKSLLWKPVVAFDVLLMVLLWSSCSAAMAVICMENYGNFHASWIPICSRVHSYCVYTFAAISVGYVGALAYLLLILVSIQEAFNALLI